MKYWDPIFFKVLISFILLVWFMGPSVWDLSDSLIASQNLPFKDVARFGSELQSFSMSLFKTFPTISAISCNLFCHGSLYIHHVTALKLHLLPWGSMKTIQSLDLFPHNIPSHQAYYAFGRIHSRLGQETMSWRGSIVSGSCALLPTNTALKDEDGVGRKHKKP